MSTEAEILDSEGLDSTESHGAFQKILILSKSYDLTHSKSQ